ncbi:hypothetical protein [Vreelandella aquamarina]|uniref:Uncharacterized protein n=1 Tax=Vreelandella aquamarina TaxID=77097 RepID=A0A1N6E9T6_9GAMM|nr:hypothetical protein [Halomonas meridiana]SIN66651.1 hypothetical protein SAMN05878249_2178 [Halomonas meridiana]SIN79772.1 hypothetical protein SAMN05878438_3614 [Halomonas meridiana]SIO33732.1 hypothetical protein SAMN05878442_2429 [Halomonas meridiana]
MPAGFQVFTNNGDVLQIDNEAVVYSLRKSGQVSCSINAFNWIDYVGLLDITGINHPMVAVQSSTPCAVEIIKPTGQNFPQYGSAGRTYVKFTTNTANAQIQYFLFDQWNAPGGNSGLEIFNAQGNRVFHSDWYLMEVVGFLNVPAGTPNRTATYNAGSVGSNRALCKTLNRVITTSQQGGAPVTYKDAVRITGGNAEVSYVAAGDYGNSDGWNYLQGVPNKIIVISTSTLPANYG